ncbi:hypothetical protein NQ314_017772 [Rhamnusium bicolor]|uniref:Nuclear pore protein n=1 Tax=Rhamnusium bicolor TaxID=1586634 RepID=A0AAV8WS12_9CUCU|nr:hypothetical protein NQ314_017772 [Rhamnusium bicolor]
MEWNQIIDAIDLQQVMEMENRENNPGKSQVEQREEIERIYPTLSYLGSIESAYASVVMHYNNSFNKNSGKIDLVDEFFRLPNEFKVKEMWEIVKYMTQMPSVSKFYSIVKNDVVKTRNTNTFIDELVVQGNRYLEDRFKIYMTNKINNGNLPSVAQDDVTSTFRLVHGFVSVRLRGEYVGLQDGLIHGCPLWPMVYYCLRAGDLSAAIYCLTNNCLPEFQDVISLLECKLKNPSSPHFRMFKKNIKRLYTTNVRNSTDPFKRSAWAILGGLDEISEIAKTADDYLWVKLNMVQMDQESGCIRYKNLQHTILEEHGESHYDAFKQPLLYFKLLALTGQFEAAIDFLFRTDNFRVHAVHMAIALCELNLLVSPQDTSLPLISIDPSDAKPVHRLNFALLIKSYVEKFDAECLREALHYLFLLRHCKNLEGQHLFKISVTDLTIKTKACEKIFGKVQRDGIIKGLLDEFTDAKMFAEDVGQDLVKRDLYEEAIDLYDGVNIQYSLLTVMCKMLSKVANLENAPGSLRNKIQEKAIIVDQRFSREGCYVQDANIVNSFIKLKGLLPFFDLYREKRYPEALKAIYNLKIVPLRNAEVDERVKNLKKFTF